MSGELLRQLIAGQQQIESLLSQLVTIAILSFVLTVIMPMQNCSCTLLKFIPTSRLLPIALPKLRHPRA